MPGISTDGVVLGDWLHVQQSITKILTTPLNSRVMRRDFGSELPDLIDSPMTERVLMALFAATAQALEPRQIEGAWYGEPRFRLSQVEVLSVNAVGELEIQLRGTYFPRGHLGDFTPATDSAVANIVF